MSSFLNIQAVKIEQRNPELRKFYSESQDTVAWVRITGETNNSAPVQTTLVLTEEDIVQLVHLLLNFREENPASTYLFRPLKPNGWLGRDQDGNPEFAGD